MKKIYRIIRCSFRNISLPVLFQGFALLPDEKLESHPRGREESRCLHRRLINSCGTDASRCMPVPLEWNEANAFYGGG